MRLRLVNGSHPVGCAVEPLSMQPTGCKPFLNHNCHMHVHWDYLLVEANGT